jgi:gamma-glutamylcyclotransferase (GGCT)/AIG2-like uncharacterized protein YtfP
MKDAKTKKRRTSDYGPSFSIWSNMSTRRLNGEDRLCGDAKTIGIAQTIENYELDFTVMSKKNYAAATIVPNCGRSIWGVLYDIPDWLIDRESAKNRGRKSLDAIEDEGKNYQKIQISLIDAGGKQIEATTYIAKNQKMNLKTSSEYVKHILEGIQEHNIPEEYRRYVRSRIVNNNDELKSDLNL